jgi:hypothetical protein
MLGTASFVVKIVKDEHKVLNIFPQCLDIVASFVFIELFDFSLGDDLTLNGSLMRSLIAISISHLVVTITFQLCSQYSICCLLLLCYGVAKTYFQHVVKSKL